MSGILGQITGAVSGASGVVSAAGGLVNDVARLGQSLGLSGGIDNSGLPWGAGAWFQQLQPGSWRGVGFVLDAGDTAAGRRVAIHEYPYRDEAWAEDLGRLPRRFSLQAFMVGDDCYQQRDSMLRACEQAGAGTLVHPTLGSIQCVLLEFSCADRRERGRVVELQFTFIVAGDVRYPASAVATGQNVMAAVAKLTTASASDLGSTLRGSATWQSPRPIPSRTTPRSPPASPATRAACSTACAGSWASTGRMPPARVRPCNPSTPPWAGCWARPRRRGLLVTNSASLVTRLAGFL